MGGTTGGTAAYYNDANGITDYLSGDPNFNDFEQRQQRIGYEDVDTVVVDTQAQTDFSTGTTGSARRPTSTPSAPGWKASGSN